MKRVLSLALVFVMIVTLIVPVIAENKIPTEISVDGASVSAKVDKLNGNQNRLWITIIDNSGDKTESYMIANNAEGIYPISTYAGDYQVYVDTKGNTQVRSNYIISFNAYKVHTADYTALDAAIAAADGLAEDEYTSESWALLIATVEAGKSIDRELPFSAQETINSLMADIKNAIDSLINKSDLDEPADYTVLDSTLAYAAALNENNYTATSWAVLFEAIANGEGVARDLTSIYQVIIDGAADMLTQAIIDLVYISIPSGVIDLSVIEDLLSAGVIEVIQDEDGDIKVIDGTFIDKSVTNASEAVDVLNLTASLFGYVFIEDTSEITVQMLDDGETPAESFYRYTPIVNGIPALGSQVILIVGDDGKVKGIFSTYDKRIKEINTNPFISEQNAIDAAIALLLSDIEIHSFLNEVANANNIDLNEVIDVFLSEIKNNAGLLIYAVDETTTPSLVYAVTLNNSSSSGEYDYGYEDNDEISGEIIDIDSEDDDASPYLLPVMSEINRTYYISANGTNAGDLIDWHTNLKSWSSVNLRANDLLNNSRTFTAQKENDQYRLRDATRNIETYKTTYEGFLWLTPQLPGDIVTFTNTVSKAAVTAHANISAVYNYYKSLLGRNSYDGYGSKIKVTYDYDPNGWFFGNYKNAYWSGSQIVFGNNLDPVLDIMGHEFTHAVIDYVVPGSLFYSKQSGGLNESYADIMGNLIEDKSNAGRWTLGEDSSSGVMRSFSNPTAYGQIDNYSSYNDSIDVHYSSGIFNFAAYKMMTDNRTSAISRNTWAKVFYRSLFRLATNAKFLDARGAVISSAKALGFNASQQQAIKDAFDAVGIVESDSIRIVMRWGTTPLDLDSHLTGPAVNGSDRFHIYYAQRNYYNDGNYYSDNRLLAVDLDWDDVIGPGPEITTIRKLTPGEYRFHVHNYTYRTAVSSTVLANSGASVSIYKGNNRTPMRTFSVNPSSNGTLWSVFNLVIDSGGNITINGIDTYSYISDPGSIRARAMLGETADLEISAILYNLPAKE